MRSANIAESSTPPPSENKPGPNDTSPTNPGSVQRQSPPFNVDCVPKNIRDLEYAVRGKVLDRAFELEREMKKQKMDFDRLVRCHIGNPHAVGAPALTYIREVMSLLLCPSLFDKKAEESLMRVFKSDSIERARRYRTEMGEPGAYTHSQGAKCLRDEVAEFFERRDGVRPDSETIYLTNGASDGISTILSVIVAGPGDGILLPRPQYPLYSATMSKLNGHPEFYDLDESMGWRCSVTTIRAAWERGTAQGIDIKGIVMINPGNPAPTLFEEFEILAILKFALEKNMAVLADEVYQENLYSFVPRTNDELKGCRPEEEDTSKWDAKPAAPGSFTSFRKVLLANKLSTQLMSFHSSSKGFYGECGFRGGLMQAENLDKESLAMVYKMRSIELCSNTLGQVCMALVTCPPRPGDASYEQYAEEKAAALKDLAVKAKLTTDFFNSLEGVSCQPIKGALYAFPQITLNAAAEQRAAAAGRSADLHYALELLNQTGIVSVPGDAFGQAEGTHHLRMTILPLLADLKTAFRKFRAFHAAFTAEAAPNHA